MPCRPRYGTAGATGGGLSAQPGSLGHCFSEEQMIVRPDFSWQRRSAKTWADRNAWASCWPTARVWCVGGADGWGVDGMCRPPSVGYEPFSCDGEGTQTLKWLRGRCEDAAGNASANATVQAFRTSDDAFAGEVASLNDGTFMCPTPYTGANHYIVAYKAGAPDIAGTTVNTLVPTNIDGT